MTHGTARLAGGAASAALLLGAVDGSLLDGTADPTQFGALIHQPQRDESPDDGEYQVATGPCLPCGLALPVRLGAPVTKREEPLEPMDEATEPRHIAAPGPPASLGPSRASAP